MEAAAPVPSCHAAMVRSHLDRFVILFPVLDRDRHRVQLGCAASPYDDFSLLLLSTALSFLIEFCYGTVRSRDDSKAHDKTLSQRQVTFATIEVLITLEEICK